MTVQDILVDLYEASGKLDDIDPYTGSNFDIASEGAVRALAWLNRGYRFITNFVRADGVAIQFPRKEAILYFQTQVITGTCAAGATTYATLDSSGSDQADAHNGWILEITGGTGSGQTRLIVDYTSAKVATPHVDFDTAPDDTSTYRLSKRTMDIVNSTHAMAAYNIVASPDNSILSILKVTDIERQCELPYAGRVESFAGNLTQTTTRPTCWYSYSHGIVFDAAPTEEAWYQMEYEKEFPVLTAATDVPSIPEQWQECLYLWCRWKVLSWNQEPQAAYAAKKDFEEMTMHSKVPEQGSFNRSETGFKLEV